MRALLAIAGAALLATLLAATTRAPPRRVDAPLAPISCDELPVKSPTPIEVGDDQLTHPYHALVRVLHLPTLAPYDVPLEWVQLLGAGRSQRTAPGEYFFDDVSVGYTSVVVSDGSKSEITTSVGPVMRRNTIAARNPLVLARWATTTCDLFVLDPAHADDPLAFAGFLKDRASGSPIAGATVWCAGVQATSGADGHFMFDRPVTWSNLLHRSKVEADGYDSFVVSDHALFGPWVRRLLSDQLANFTLNKSGAKPPPTIPALAK